MLFSLVDFLAHQLAGGVQCDACAVPQLYSVLGTMLGPTLCIFLGYQMANGLPKVACQRGVLWLPWFRATGSRPFADHRLCLDGVVKTTQLGDLDHLDMFNQHGQDTPSPSKYIAQFQSSSSRFNHCHTQNLLELQKLCAAIILASYFSLRLGIRTSSI